MAEMTNVLQDHAGAVRKTIIREGTTGRITIPENCKVFVDYIICGEGMSDPFDSTLLRGYPSCIDCRAPEVIPGLYAAIASMSIREVAKVWIRSDFGYGCLGCPPRIPPSLDLHCIVEVLDVIEENQLKLVPYMTGEERGMLEFGEIIGAAKELRFDGNGAYKDAAYWSAVKRYRKAADILYMNLSACYLKLKRPQQTCIACQLAIRAKNYSKAAVDGKLYYR
jgi:hypothetical protein